MISSSLGTEIRLAVQMSVTAAAAWSGIRTPKLARLSAALAAICLAGAVVIEVSAILDGDVFRVGALIVSMLALGFPAAAAAAVGRMACRARLTPLMAALIALGVGLLLLPALSGIQLALACLLTHTCL